MATVDISQGKLKGSKCYTDKGTEYYEFLGIPYAKPPIGHLRFKNPQHPEKWSGIRDATTVSQSHVACQIDLIKRNAVGSEDCLYLNVFTPNLPQSSGSELLPVMLSIHGGGYLHGNGISKADLGPDFLIENNVVFVSINYRLGIFGFLSLDIPEVTGNMGLKDQVQALIWVQNNIDKFGGDKNNVTIFGISAGSSSVEHLILSPKSKGLFHKGILQSGSSLNHWAINFYPQKLLQALLEKLSYEGDLQNHQAIYEFLMSLPPVLLTEESYRVIEASHPEFLFFGFVPTIEKDYGDGQAFLTSEPYKLLKEGNFHHVPVIKGFCEKECYMMSLVKLTAVIELGNSGNFIHHWAYSMKSSDHNKYNAKFKAAYIRHDAQKEEEIVSMDFFSDYDFVSGILLSGKLMSGQGVPVYLYRFAYDGKMNFFKNLFNIQEKGASHADDATYIFKHEFSKLADECDINMRDKITKMWTNFAKTGNPVPDSSDLTPWPAYTEGAPVYLNIDKEFSVETQYEPTRMEIFDEIYHKYLK